MVFIDSMRGRLGAYLVLLGTLNFWGKIIAQGITASPYSQFGIGDLEYIGSSRNMALGGAAASVFGGHYINMVNPAALAYNRKNVAFEAGFYGQYLRIQNTEQLQKIFNGNIAYMALLMPISTKNWTISMGFNPYSNANSKFSRTYSIVNDTHQVRVYSQYEGGLNQIFLSHGFKITKGLSVGISTSYVFGTILRTHNLDLNAPWSTRKTIAQSISTEKYRTLEVKLGLGYVTKISENYAISLGASASFNRNMDSKQTLYNTQSMSRILNYQGTTNIYRDTTEILGDGIRLPTQYRLGVGLERQNKWTVFSDFAYTDFSQYRDFTNQLNYTNGLRLSLGAEYVPNYNAFRGLHKRIMYRIGAYNHQTPYVIEGNRVTENAITGGIGLPIGKGNAMSLNLGWSFGQRGTLANDLIRERFVRFHIHMTVNDKWFVRYKVD